MKKDILFMCQFFYPEYVSSATLPWDTAEFLSKAGYKVDALCGYPKEYIDTIVPKKECVNGVNIRRVKYIELSRKSFIGRLINYFSLTVKMMLNVVKIRNYKVVFVYSNPPILPLVAVTAKKLFGVKIVFICYDVYPEIAQSSGAIGENGIISSFMNKINDKLFKSVDSVIALSNEMKEYLLKHRNVSKGQIHVIPNWYEDLKKDKKAAVNNKAITSIKEKNDFIISYLGNMGTCQDMDTILESIKISPDYKFIFAGHGNKLPYVKEFVRENKLDNVYVFDFLKGDEYEYVLGISDCFIVSLEHGLEGLCVPSKTYSYMAEGKPIIAIMSKETDISYDLSELGAGYVKDNGDYKGVSECYSELRTNPQLYKDKADKCISIFKQKYEKNVCLKQYKQMIEGLLK